MTGISYECKKCSAKASVKHAPAQTGFVAKSTFLSGCPEQTERFIEKYNMFTHDEKILVAVSGGKDSLSLWDILLRLGYQADGFYIGLGIDEGINYSHESTATR